MAAARACSDPRVLPYAIPGRMANGDLSGVSGGVVIITFVIMLVVRS
jgi:hypothetical protein